MNFYDELIDYMEDQGVGTAAVDIFRPALPAQPINCIALVGRDGPILGDSKDIRVMQFPRFQVVIRNEEFATADAKFQAVRTLLHGLTNKLLPSWRIMFLEAEQEGGPVPPRDEVGYFMYSVMIHGQIHAL